MASQGDGGRGLAAFRRTLRGALVRLSASSSRTVDVATRAAILTLSVATGVGRTIGTLIGALRRGGQRNQQ